MWWRELPLQPRYAMADFATFDGYMREFLNNSRWRELCDITDFMESKEIAERAFRFAIRIVKLYERMITLGGAARALAPQILQCGTSIGANLEEATAGQTKPDFIAKVSISRKEARESVYWLRLFVASDLLLASDVEWELNEAKQFVAILGAIVFNARSNPNRG